MNLSLLAKRIKLSIGIYGIAVPIDDLDSFISDIILDITLPVFSQYSPFQQTMYLDVNKLECLEKRDNYESYVLPDFQGRKLLYVKDIRYDDRSITSLAYWGTTAPVDCGLMTNELLMMNASNLLVQQQLPKMNFRFEHPRTIYLFNCIASHQLIFDLMFEHDRSLQSIPPTSDESFFRLAVLDVKENLYGIMKHYSTIQTAKGTVELKIDDWADAANERKSLLESWDEVYPLDLNQLTFS